MRRRKLHLLKPVPLLYLPILWKNAAKTHTSKTYTNKFVAQAKKTTGMNAR
jgi:hypothetical protein